MLTHLRPALVLTAVFTLVLGVAYPLAMTGIAQLVAAGQANGSLVEQSNKVIGSSLIGQNFAAGRYFHGRPSAAGANGYDAGASSGSNLGPTSKKLKDRVAADVAALKTSGATVLPVDGVTASASGLDPHISPAYAGAQIARVASARGIPVERVSRLVEAHTQQPALGIFGQPRVNVLALNLALDAERSGGAN